MLLDPLDCIEIEPSSGSGGFVAGASMEAVIEAAPEIVCFELAHVALATASTISLCVYTMLVLRLIRVGGSLASVEFNPLR